MLLIQWWMLERRSLLCKAFIDLVWWCWSVLFGVLQSVQRGLCYNLSSGHGETSAGGVEDLEKGQIPKIIVNGLEESGIRLDSPK